MEKVCPDCTIDFNVNPSPPKNFKIGLILASIAGGGALLLTAISAPFVTPALRRICLPFVPATTNQVTNVFTILKGRSGNLIDLGSGDGRIVIEGAKRGFNKSIGVELNPWLVLYSRISAISSGVSKSTRFTRKDLFKFDLKPFNNVVIFGVDSMMSDLEIKFKKELEPGSSIVACRFPLPNLIPEKVEGEGIDTVWIYSINKNNK